MLTYDQAVFLIGMLTNTVQGQAQQIASLQQSLQEMIDRGDDIASDTVTAAADMGV